MEINFHSASWVAVAAWAQSRIDTLRVKNETDLDPLETARVRGQIKALKELLALPEAAARGKGTESALSPIRL
jgi:hypothetical protein